MSFLAEEVSKVSRISSANIGTSPSGKARDFDSLIPGFKSQRSNQLFLENQIYEEKINLLILKQVKKTQAGMVELADTMDLGSISEKNAGSSPVTCTNPRF